MPGTSRFDEFVDIEQLARAQQAFSNATGLGTVTVDNLGNPVVPASNFCEFCKRMRALPTTSKLCRLCDAHGTCQSAVNGRPYIYRCHARLIDLSVPLIADGLYIGGIVCGQVLLTDGTAVPPSLVAADNRWRADPALRELYDLIPRVSVRKIQGAAEALFDLAREATESVGRPISVSLPAVPIVHRGKDPRMQAMLDAALRADLPTAIDTLTGLLDEIWATCSTQERMVAVQAVQRELIAVVAQVSADDLPRCQQLSTDWCQQLPVDRLSAQVVTEQLADAIVAAAERASGRPVATIGTILNALARDPLTDIDVERAAESLSMSTSQFSRSFKRLTGLTFATYKVDRRIRRAKLLLSQTSLPISGVAAATGFTRSGYFARVFHSSTGQTPHEWRRHSVSIPVAQPIPVTYGAHSDVREVSLDAPQ
ncbi:MAG: PocR ligand-binding domain-containing protein [Propionibacteriaceae bacterium]|nr:PocR ligand-binding domain-containing protein [Propionibacteriaceae bacterium]